MYWRQYIKAFIFVKENFGAQDSLIHVLKQKKSSGMEDSVVCIRAREQLMLRKSSCKPDREVIGETF